ncbi:hypothetical protein FB451DRAFT_42387 [Mycena latifolia]|nr:hypothetical protein FB451DRAFT_42387 [Mycena latifolia]
MLDDISAVKSWDKVNSGMAEMYTAEMLGKLPLPLRVAAPIRGARRCEWGRRPWTRARGVGRLLRDPRAQHVRGGRLGAQGRRVHRGRGYAARAI